jgi:hypothetical protein
VAPLETDLPLAERAGEKNRDSPVGSQVRAQNWDGLFGPVSTETNRSDRRHISVESSPTAMMPLDLCALPGDLFSINRPGARRGEFDQMAVRVSKVEAITSQLPRPLLFYCDSSRLQPRFPVGQFGG